MIGPTRRILVLPGAVQRSGRTAEIIVLGDSRTVADTIPRVLVAVKAWRGFLTWEWLGPAVGVLVTLGEESQSTDPLAEALACLRTLTDLRFSWRTYDHAIVGEW